MEYVDKHVESPPRILFAEDDPLLSEDLSLHLTESGYHVAAVATSGEEAVRKALETRPDLVIMDIKLAGEMDGIEAAGLIREKMDTAILYLTSYTESADFAIRAKRTEPQGYLKKTISPLDLERAVDIALYKHQMERRLRASEEKYRALVETAPNGIVEIDLDGRVTAFNSAFSQMSGCDPAELTGSFIGSLAENDVRLEVLVRHLESFPGSLPEPTPRIGRYVTMAGRTIDVEAHWNYKWDDLGNVVGLIAVVTDITERKRAEDQLKQAHDELERRVEERTVELSEANERLRNEVAERKKAEERIKSSLKEKEVLLREIHHRVKNNLAVIVSLLGLQSEYAPDEVTRKMLEDSQARIRSMSLAHELLYQSENLAHIGIRQYVDNLAAYLSGASIGIGTRINVIKEIEDVSFGLDTAIPVGFIVTELISNCIKHAFPDREEGTIKIHLKTIGEGEFEFLFQDDGIGIPAHVDPRNSKSLGLELVDAFVEQLKGQIEIRHERGTEVRITFEEKETP